MTADGPPAHDDWDRHWDDYSTAVTANPAQRYRQRLAFSLLEAHGPPDRLLDVGCGQGDFLAAAAARWPAAKLAGLEISKQGVHESRQKAPAALVVQRDLLQDLPVPPAMAGWATHALCSEVLEHVDDPVALLRRSREYLSPGCRIVVTVPGGPMSAFDRHIGHRQHFTPESAGEALRSAGFKVLHATGAGYPFFNLYRRVVIGRGDRLVDDLVARPTGRPSFAARAAMLAFRPLFVLNRPASDRGWQTVVVGQNPT